MNLAGKSVIVTGGASGLGLAVLRFFASQACKINILDLAPTASLLSSLAAEFPAATFASHTCDISDWDSQAAVFADVYSKSGGIDIVFANAGITEVGHFLEKSEGEPVKPQMKTLDVDLVGTLYTVKLAVHYMRKNTGTQKGSIVCTASQAGIYPFPIAPMYGTAKHGVVGAVRSLGLPLQLEGIQINGICPNVVETHIADDRLFSNMILTPISKVVEAVRDFVTKPEVVGTMVEISGDTVTVRAPPAPVDEVTRKNWESFWKLGYA